jgi:hypothetical protein
VLQCNSPCFFVVASLAYAVTDERLSVAFRVQGMRDFFLPVVQPFYGLYCADGERGFAIEGIMGLVHYIFGYGAVVETWFW